MPYGEDIDELSSLVGSSTSQHSYLLSSQSTELEKRCRSFQSWMEEQTAGINLTWENLNVEIKDKSLLKNDKGNHENRKILNNMSGSVHSGMLLAVMGGSGAGKSTFLNCLADRNCKGLSVSGKITVNGHAHKNYIRAISAYVQQDDLFLPGLTVREHLIFQAKLRMDHRTTRKERLQRIEEILKELGLKNCENTVIGQPGVKKSLSGGERKRLTFATEILTDPALLFCDEPTTGLDSFMAHNVVSILYEMASKGKIVICTIHQPSSEVFRMFDRLLLIAEGRTAYLGPSYEALEFFSSLGYICPLTFNPADYYIQVLAIQPGFEERDKQIINKICNWYDASSFGKNEEWNQHGGYELSEVYHKVKSKKASWFVQFYMLLWRALLEAFRNPSIMTIRTFQKIFLALMIGSIYFQVKINQAGIMAVNGAIFVFITENTFPSMYGVLQTFPQELPVFLRENQNGIYRVDAYYLSKIISLIPGFIFEPVLFTVISYWMIGLNSDLDRFFLTMLIIVLTANTASACGFFFSAACASPTLAMTILVPIDVVLMITGGIFINLKTLSKYISWLQYLSWFRYSNEALMVVQWENVHNITCSSRKDIPCVREGVEVIEDFGFSRDENEWNFICLFILYIAFHLMGLIALILRSKKK
ncbi:protein white-like [Centruroides vittatus]|uniref:protein white-like n=1 Tax=Centruroides vittatus TaxID=120091 RepID=UPI00350FF16A